MINDIKQVEQLIYHSYMRIWPDLPKGPDSQVRHPEYTRLLLDRMGGADRTMNNVLVTGSKGKGSLSLLLAAVFSAAGIRAGLFTSPHLKDFTERIRVDGKSLPDAVLVESARKLEPFYRELEDSLPGDRYLGPVGMAAVLAMDVFRKEGAGWNVVELGRGARFDDVNQVSGRYAFINRVFPEHTENLGKTLREVAWNKAGVIRPGMGGAFSAAQDPEALEEIRREAASCGVDLYVGGEDFSVRNVRISLEGTTFDYVEQGRTVYRDLTLGLLGRHQADNCALALFGMRKILGDLPEKKLRETLPGLRWFGRMEILSRDPFALLDGCIGRECVNSVLEILDRGPSGPLTVVVGIPEEKDYPGVIGALSSRADRMIMTHADNDFLKFSPDQVEEGRRIRRDLEYIPDVRSACASAVEQAGREGRILYIGTQSLIKDVKNWYGQTTLNVF